MSDQFRKIPKDKIFISSDEDLEMISAIHKSRAEVSEINGLINNTNSALSGETMNGLSG